MSKALYNLFIQLARRAGSVSDTLGKLAADIYGIAFWLNKHPAIARSCQGRKLFKPASKTPAIKKDMRTKAP